MKAISVSTRRRPFGSGLRPAQAARAAGGVLVLGGVLSSATLAVAQPDNNDERDFFYADQQSSFDACVAALNEFWPARCPEVRTWCSFQGTADDGHGNTSVLTLFWCNEPVPGVVGGVGHVFRYWHPLVPCAPGEAFIGPNPGHCDRVAPECDPENPQSCSCADPTEPPFVGASASFEFEATRGCAGLGGEAGVTVTVDYSGSEAPPACGNDCTGECELTGRGAVGFELCGGGGIEVAVEGSVSVTRRHPQVCDAASCTLECDPDQACTTSEGSVRGTASRSFERSWGFTARRGLAEIGIGCRADLELGADAALSRSSQEAIGAIADCPECERTELALGSFGSATGSCGLTIATPGLTRTFECEECLELEAALSVSGSVQSESCEGGRVCAGIDGHVSGSVHTPPVCFDLFGYVVEARISAGATATVSGDTCEGTEGEFKKTFSATFDASSGSCGEASE